MATSSTQAPTSASSDPAQDPGEDGPRVRRHAGRRRRLLRRAALVVAGTLALGYVALVVLTVAVDGWISREVTIQAPVEAVWEYGSDSTRAAEWSVYFDHITPVEGEGMPADGQVGALRVCWRNPDETGISWDEETVAATPLEHRQIRTFNLQGFPFGALSRAQEYEVHQDYERIDDGSSVLRFRSKLVRREGLGNLLAWPVVKGGYILFGRAAGDQVFVWNLENIAAAVEARHEGRPYDRPHPWEAELPWEASPVRWWLEHPW